MKERSFACLMWIAFFVLLAIGCALCSRKNHALGFYAVGSVAIAVALWKSEGVKGKAKDNENDNANVNKN